MARKHPINLRALPLPLATKHKPRRIGYARVSTETQNIEMQLDALKRAKCGVTYSDVESGGGKHLPQLDAALRALHRGDTFIVWKLDRIGRNVSHILEVVAWLSDGGIAFETLTEGRIDGTPAGKVMLHVAAMFAELERDTILERTSAGLAAARLAGRIGGRRKCLDEEDVKNARDLAKRRPMAEVANRFRISVSTLNRYLREGGHEKLAARQRELRAGK